MTMGGLGILGELMYDTVNQVDNGAYGKVRIAETFAGPTSGLFFDALTITEGGMSAIGDMISGEGIRLAPIFSGVDAAGEENADVNANDPIA